MTNRQRITRRAPSRRTSRLVWVNDEAALSATSSGLQLADMLTNAGSLKHDATITRIVGQVNIQGMREAATTGSFEIKSGLWVGSEQSLITTIPDPNIDTEEAAWLWKHTYFTTLHGDGTLPTQAGRADFHLELDVKAQRRFRENFMTLWLILNVVNVGATDSATYQMATRTLLRVP